MIHLQLGIFARTFARGTLDEVLTAIAGHGLTTTQFNLSCAGLPTLPRSIDPSQASEIRQACARHNVEMAAISGTFNAIHPDHKAREEGIAGCLSLIGSCPALGTSLVTLCTGTRNADNMWEAHPDNSTPDAWRDLLETLSRLLPAAEAKDVVLGIEPEPANVVNSAMRARALLDEIASPNLRIILDGANLFGSRQSESRMKETLTEAVELLGPDIALVHAKDITDDPSKQRQAAGTGRLDFGLLFSLLHQHHYSGPVIMHNLAESEVAGSLRFLREAASRWYQQVS